MDGFTPHDPESEIQTAPQNLDAEQALLGALMYDNELYHQISGFLKPDHFYDPIHARIYETCSALISSGTLGDAVALKTALEGDEGLAELGGATVYLALLSESAAHGAAAPEYAKIIVQLSQRRELIRVGDEICYAARQDSAREVASIIEEGEGALFNLAEQGNSSRGLRSFKEALNVSVANAVKAHENGGLSGLSTGLGDLDEKLHGLHPSDLIILAGRPSMGKTALATNMAYRAALSGEPVAFFSLEMSEDQLANRILSDRTAIPSAKIRAGEANDNAIREWMEAAQELSGLPLHIDDTGGLGVAALCARARRMKRLHGLSLVVVDYLQLCTAAGMRAGANRVEEVSKITVSLKALAKELNVPVIALSQLSRQVESREDKRPQLSDLRESGSIEQDADVVLFVYREEYYLERKEPKPDTPQYLDWEDEMRAAMGKAEVIIGKQRHGPLGAVKCAFDGATTRFSDLAR